MAKEKLRFEINLKSAEAGDAKAQNNLGWRYASGTGVEKDEIKAVEWYRKSAEQGYARAQNNLGYRYENGRGVVKDEQQAFEWYKKAAEQGDARAQCNLGECYEGGKGIEKNEQQAFEWYKKAAEQGDARAQCNLGECYESGKGIEKNEQQAFEWYGKAAEQGNANAQFYLGVCYEFGKGIGHNYEEAARWYEKAANQGHIDAQCSLGACCEFGEGVKQSAKEAVKFYKKAAEQNEARAQFRLGMCYVNGLGVEKNKKEAVKWYSKAAEQGFEVAKLRLKNEPFPNIEKSIVLENTGDKHIDFLPNCDSKIDRINLALSSYKESFSLYKDDAVLEKILKAYISFFRYVDEKTNFDMQTDAFIEASRYAKEYYDDAKKQNSEFIRVYRNKTILFFRALDKNDRQDLMQKLSESICIFANFYLKAQPEVQQYLQKVNQDVHDNEEVEINDISQPEKINYKLEIFEKSLQKKLEDSLHNDRVIYQGLAQRKEDSIDTTLKVASILGGTVQNHWVGFVGNLGANMTKEIRDKIHKHACERTKMFSGLRIGDVTIKVAKRVTDRYKDQIEKLSIGPGGGVEKLVEYFHNKAIDDLHSSVSTIDALWKKLSGFEEIISSPEEKLFESLTKAGGENCYLELDETLGNDFASINKSKVGRAWDAKEMLLQIAFSFNSTTYLSNNNGINGFEKYGCCYVNLAEEIKDRKIYTTQLAEQKGKDKDKVKSGLFNFFR